MNRARATAGHGRALPVSDHCDGRRFFNPHPIRHRFGDLTCWLRKREPTPWQRTTRFDRPPAPPPRSAGLRITWINHASVLIQVDGLNVLTDPVFSDRVGPAGRFGARRYHPPGVALDELPPIDLVLISHAHYDHLDRPSLARLHARDAPAVVTGLGMQRYLRAETLHVGDWWQRLAPRPDCAVTVTPARHWSRRTLFDRNRALWCGFWLHTRRGGVFFAGDTGFDNHFCAIRDRLGRPRLALLPIGAYAPRWFMAAQHMNPDDAVAAHRALGARHSVGIHFATFRLSDEGQWAPVDTLARARRDAGLAETAFIAPEFGVGYDYPDTPGTHGA